MQRRFGKKGPSWRSGSSRLADVWYRLSRSRVTMLGLTIVLLVCMLAICADLIADYDTKVLQQNALERLQAPSTAHWFGTDAYGRDLFARVVHGARYSLSIGLLCSAISLVCGTAIGAVAAYVGGTVDNIIMRILDVITCIPAMVLALALISAFGQGFWNMVLAISLATIAGFARVARSDILSIVRQDYVEAARACGVGRLRTIMVYILPNAIGLLVVQTTMNIASLIIAAAALSFIGMGVQPPAPEWGTMLAEAKDFMRLYPHYVIVPGLAIVITSLGFNLLGDGLAEALDPRMKD